jgi:predicted DNA-binding protein
MRAILNISLPAEKKVFIEKRAKKAGKTISAYILYAIELEKSLIQEDEILAMAAQAEKDYKAGKTTKLRSLADLIK